MAFGEKSRIFISNERKSDQLAAENRMTEAIGKYESTASRLRAQRKELENVKSELEIKLKEKGKLYFINVNIPFDFMYTRNCCTFLTLHKCLIVVYQSENQQTIY